MGANTSDMNRPVIGEDVRMMRESKWWIGPAFGICPLKRPRVCESNGMAQLAFIHADTGPRVYLCENVFMIGGKTLGDFECIEYDSFEAAYDDGWRVDRAE